MTRHSVLCTAASAAFFTIATCAGASASSFDSDIGSSAAPQFDQGLQQELQQDSSSDSQPTASSGSHGLTLEDFVNADKNSDGYLNHKEFKALAAIVRKQGEGPSALEKVRKFSADDTNHDGKISAEELGVIGPGVG